MKIALVGPSELTEFDKQEIEDNLIDFVEKGNDIVILAYRSIEIEVFKFFVKNMDEKKGANFARQLHIYTFQPFELLSDKLATSIQFLIDAGATYYSFHSTNAIVKRSEYIQAWNDILIDVDIVISFYDGEKTSLLIPVDEAKKKGKKGIIFQLPRLNEERFLLEPEKKVRIIHSEE